MSSINDTLFIIPARGGSKGLPGKNVKLLNGKPLIHYTIEAAQEITDDANICISSDDQEIIVIAKQTGIEVPFVRPAELATDTASSYDVLIHAVKFYQSKGREYQKVMLLQPTSPLRTAKDIQDAYRLLETKHGEGIVSVAPVDHNPLWTGTLPQDLCMDNFLDSNIASKRRQDLPGYYQLNGALYLASINYFISHRGFLGNKTYAYVMPKERSVDIDDLVDFLLAESILNSVK